MIVGIDFDNTLIGYDEIFYQLAQEAGLVPAGAAAHKASVREAARRSPEGDIAWQRLQSEAYGPRITEALPTAGALAFVQACAARGIPVYVISHKTPFAAQDTTGTNLQEAALGWLQTHGFFSEATGLTPVRCRFGNTRAEKIAHIRNLGCTHFIDDLEETFRDPGFPSDVHGFLYSPWGTPESDLPGITLAPSWDALQQRILGG